MNDWLAISIVVVIVFFIIGTFSTVQKDSSTPLRKKGLNDLTETLPRTHKEKHTLPTVNKVPPKNAVKNHHK